MVLATASKRNKTTVLLIFVIVVLSQSTIINGQFFGLFDSFSPTKIVDSFRQLVANSRQQIAQQLIAHRRLIKILEEISAFTDDQKTMLEDMQENIWQLANDVPKLYETILKSSETLISKVKRFDTFYNVLEETSSLSTFAADEVLLRLKELMSAMQANDDQLPPSAFEIRNAVMFDKLKLSPFAPAGGWFNFLDQYNPSAIIGNFKDIVVNAKVQINELVAANEKMIALLGELEEFAIFQEGELEVIGSSITSLIMDLPNLFGRIERAKIDLVDLLQRINPVEEQIRAETAEMLMACEEALNKIRDIMSSIQALGGVGTEKDLPPTLYELVSKRLRRSMVVEDTENMGSEYQVFNEGMQLKKDGKWEEAYEKFSESWKMFNETQAEGKLNSVELIFVLDYLQMAAHKTGKIAEARWLCQFLLDNEDLTKDQVERFNTTVNFYDSELAMESIKELTNTIDSMPEEKQVEMAKELASAKQYDVCGDEFNNEPLFCQINHRNWHPLLVLSPVKEEIIAFDPLVVLFHDVATENEIEALKSEVKSRLHDAGVVNGTMEHGSKIVYETRKARHAWIPNSKVNSLTPRLEAITSLDPTDGSCEDYQVGHYSIGGHYMPHFDNFYINSSSEEWLERGDRIATLLMYLNEVQEGGATVFKNLKIKVEPVKGAGLFWFNIFKNETADSRSFHGACPVIRGEKWVTNKWFRFRGQFSHKPCGKSEDELYFMDDLIISQNVRKYSNSRFTKMNKKQRVIKNNPR